MALQMMRLTNRWALKRLVTKPQLLPLQAVFISGRATREKPFPKPPPFPYNQKHLSRLRAWFENPLKWFDENTKLIVVEGNIAAGKSDFAKKLATELEMYHMPEATVDMIYVNKYGYDMRQLDEKLPLDVQSFDVKDFYRNPTSKLSNKFQMNMYYCRFEQYIDALAHIFNTGQGVVLERCVYSDIVFMQTMHKFGYLAPRVRDYYLEARANSLPDLMRPHLVIYLDSPVDILMERVKKRANDFEISSKVLVPEYLKYLETEYKEYLKDLSQHSELLFYDWSKFGDIDVVIEDIERIDFDRYDKYDTKMSDWLLFDYWDYVSKRYEYTTRKDDYITQLQMIPMWNTPELLPETAHLHEMQQLWANFPGNKYEYGFNPDQGDKVLFKTKIMPRSQ